MREIKWGIMGPGRIANKFALDLAMVEDARLWAVASRDLTRAQSFAEKHDAHSFYGSYQEMLEQGAVDIIYIATPHTFHYEQTLSCLQHNIPVLCEKPITINRSELDVVLEIAAKKQTFVMEALWTRFIPSMQKVLEIIRSGVMGEVENVEAEFCFAAEQDHQHRLYNMDLGGGATLDIGIYPIFLAYLLMGVPERIEATGQLASTGADQTSSVNLFYAGKRMAALHASILYNSDMPARITMTKGYILMQPRWHESPSITLLKAGYDPEIIACPTTGKGYYHEILECHHCLRADRNESDLWSHQNNRELMDILDEVRRQIGVTYPKEG